MTYNILKEINYDQLRSRFLKYTRKAFNLLPEIVKPRILDIGCGNGIPTLELAKLSHGEIIGVDIDQSALNELNTKAKKMDLVERVKGINCSMFELDFPEESFDIIWAEGAIASIGFEKGLKEWARLLKKERFMVLHDDLKDKEFKLKIIPKCGYQLLEHFQLPDDAWWVDYYGPIEKRINELKAIHGKEPTFLDAIKQFENEINSYKKNPKLFRSIFYILKKLKNDIK